MTELISFPRKAEDVTHKRVFNVLMDAVRLFAPFIESGHRPFRASPALRISSLVPLIVLLFLTACAPKTRPPMAIPEPLVKIRPDAFPDFSDDMSYDSLKRAVERSLSYVTRLQPSASFRFGAEEYTASHLCASMEAFLELVGQDLCPSDLRKAIERSFCVYRAAGDHGRGQTLFTGYYEPTLRGSLQPSPDYPHPVYRKPDDWVGVDLGLFYPEHKGRRIVGRYVNQTVIPYFTRKDIDTEGRLLG
ncbi:MAG: MltA domain-containing protein, partial [Thermodesulfobacteriota bacterium]|nr:MltA domain-containing protein [Thermodesulfobacteriota bacterium]